MNLLCFHLPAAQYKWLERDLASVDRKVTPWLVATWHAPWYGTYTAHYREVECMRVEMEELLYNYGVDIFLNGHVSKFCSSFIFSICTGMTGCTPFFVIIIVKRILTNKNNNNNNNIIFIIKKKSK